MYYYGIDYSLTSPAICCYTTDSGDFCVENCQFYYVTNKPKFIGKIYKNITGIEQNTTYINNQERFDILSQNFINIKELPRKTFAKIIEGLKKVGMGFKGLFLYSFSLN